MGMGNESLFAACPRWPPRRYMVKTLQNLLQNQQTDFHETWYVASLTPAIHSLFTLWQNVDSDLFYGKIKLCKNDMTCFQFNF